MAKKKYADKFVGITPDDFSKLEDRHIKVLEILSKLKAKRFLDIGCGDGNFTMLMAKVCGAEEVYGIDISEKGVGMARKNGVKAFKVDVDEERLPFDDNYFDIVTALEVIEHLYDPDHFLDEVYRVLKPNGIFVLTTPNLASLYNRISLLFGYQPFYTNVSIRRSYGHIPFIENIYKRKGIVPAPDHIRLFTVKSLRDKLNDHNFQVIRVEGVGTIMRMRDHKLYLLMKFVDNIVNKFPSISTILVFVCIKKSKRGI